MLGVRARSVGILYLPMLYKITDKGGDNRLSTVGPGAWIKKKTDLILQLT